MFSLNGTLKKSGSVGRWETKQFIGMAKYDLFQIQVREIESTRLLRQPCSTRNKFQISLILNLLAHLEAFVYQNCHFINVIAELALRRVAV